MYALSTGNTGRYHSSGLVNWIQTNKTNIRLARLGLSPKEYEGGNYDCPGPDRPRCPDGIQSRGGITKVPGEPTRDDIVKEEQEQRAGSSEPKIKPGR